MAGSVPSCCRTSKSVHGWNNKRCKKNGDCVLVFAKIHELVELPSDLVDFCCSKTSFGP